MKNTKMKKLEQIRLERGMNKSDVARAARMQSSVVGWIESGRFIPYDSQLVKIAAAVGWEGDPRELLEEVEE